MTIITGPVCEGMKLLVPEKNLWDGTGNRETRGKAVVYLIHEIIKDHEYLVHCGCLCLIQIKLGCLFNEIPAQDWRTR
jgi:hypothetical protein